MRSHLADVAGTPRWSGAQFDIYETQLRWRDDDDRLVADLPPVVFLPARMSDRDERGPLAFGEREWNGAWTERSFLAWASDREGGAGGFDLYVIDCKGAWRPHRGLPCWDESVAPPLVPLAGLNSARDELYLSKAYADRSLLFASNRDAPEGVPAATAMDLYSARWADTTELGDAPQTIERVAVLSSSTDDTAPFVWRPYQHDGSAEMVFVSDRAGGVGEHDIYCARYDAKTDRWSTPKNLGPAINSAKDEYRPIIFELNSTRFLIFSSTREGGQGGYDLYVVGYPGCR